MTVDSFIQETLKPENFWIATAVIVALFGERLWSFIQGPSLEIGFKKNSERCFRTAFLPSDQIQDTGIFKDVQRQYFRLEVKNNGGFAKIVKVRTDLLDRKFKELDRFEPTLLRWINNREENDLAKGEISYVNLVSQVLNYPARIQNRFRIEVADWAPRAIAWDRPLDTYILKVVVHGENFSPITKHFRFIPSRYTIQPGRLGEIKDP